MGASRLGALAASSLAHVASAALLLLVLLAAGQPIFAEDTWWHLGMGAAYAEAGPWLAGDPFLQAALGTPAPAAWLADLAFFAVQQAGGFTALRVFHAGCVAAILGLAWIALRRVSASAAFASAATAVFAALSAYRLFQLRPHLATILAALVVALLLFTRARAPSWPRVLAAALVFALWANLHGAFVVGLVLLAAAVAGSLLDAWREASGRDEKRARARRLAVALVLCGLATLANPQGPRPHGLYFSAGEASPALGVVADEWASAGLLSLPRAGALPSGLDWLLLWGIVLATAAVAGAVAVGWLRGREDAVAGGAGDGPGGGLARRVDPALLAVALASLVGAVAALRLSWLVIFPLLLLGQALRGLAPAATLRVASAALALLLLPAFASFGDWPKISLGVRPRLYARPYPAAKYPAHAVWFLEDAGVRGRLFNDYGNGNFLGYWLAPELRVFVNGSLNVEKERLRAHGAALRARGTLAGETLEQMLDRYQIDVFLGTGLPLFSSGRPNVQTTTHLEGRPGWIPVFRNLRSAVYLRRGPGNDANLDRIATFYESEGLPFDRDRGFDVAEVIRTAPRWAFAHGMIPGDLQRVKQATSDLDPGRRRASMQRLAGVQAALGLYEEAAVLDRRLLASGDPPVAAARRLVWSLSRLGRYQEAARAADRLLQAAAPDDDASQQLAAGAREIAALAASGRDAEAARLAAVLPVFEPFETSWLLMGVQEPEARIR